MSEPDGSRVPSNRPARRTLARRLLVWYAVSIVAVIAVLGVVQDRVFRSILADNVTSRLTREAHAVAGALGHELPLDDPVDRLAADLGARITVIDADGVVLADSHADPASMDNHADRPEVAAALSGGAGVSTRRSATVEAPFHYVAVPDGRGWIVRLALPSDDVDEEVGRLRGVVLGGAALAALVGVAVVWIVARTLARPLDEVTESAIRISEGDFDERIPSSSLAELDALGRAVNAMSGELRRRIEESETERLLRDRVLSSLQEGMVLIEADGTVSYHNAAAIDLLGAVADRASLLVPSNLGALVEVARDGGEPSAVDIRRGAPTRWIRSTAVPLEGGEQVLLVLLDVTASLRAEAMRRDFVADASHELKTPVASIQAAVETVLRALEDGDDDGARRFARRAETEGHRLGRLVSDLLDLSRLESGLVEVTLVRLDEVVAEVIAARREAAAEQGVEMTSHLVPVELQGGRRDLELAVRNLVDNALRHTPAGGRIDVRASRTERETRIEVQDTGEGIPSRYKNRVFERFFRVDEARDRSTGGTGLGLAIVKHVAEEHGGRVEVDSELGVGSTFRLVLPLPPPGGPAA